MLDSSVAVTSWSGPGSIGGALCERDLMVIGVAAPATTIRHDARTLIRAALRDVLGVLLARAPDAVPLASQPGQPLRVELPGQSIGLSVSHEPGLSLAAIRRRGAVGIDLMRATHLPDWECVAHAYLGPQATLRIGRAPQALRPQAFAREWTRQEACLKCHGAALEEWSPALDRTLAQCHVTALELEQGLVGTVATLA